MKKRLARVQENSLHFSVTSFIWEKYLESGKVHACKYWWVLFPTSLVLTPIIFIAIVVVGVVAFFFGHLLNFSANDEEKLFSPHRRRANGQPWPRFIPAPYQVVLPAAFLISSYRLITDSTRYTIYGLIVLAVTMALGGLLLLISKNWNQPVLKAPREVAARSIDSGYNKMCPMLIIVPKPSDSDPESDLIKSSDSTA